MNMQVVVLHIGQFVDAPRNANKMEPETYEKLVASIKRFGFWQPVLVRGWEDSSSFEIIDGHHRVRAAKDIGLEKLPAIDVHGLTDAEIEMLRLALNRLRGESDLAIVADVFKGLTDAGVKIEELDATGFTTQQVTDLLESLTRGEGDDRVLAAQDMPEPEDDKPKPFTLEIEFTSKEMYQHCRRRLRKAAGKGEDLYVGLMRVLGEDPGEEKWTTPATTDQKE